MQFLYRLRRKVVRLHLLYVGTKLLTLSQSQVCTVFTHSIVLYYCKVQYLKSCLANYYNETIVLNIPSSNRTDIECRAFVNELPEVPCCNKSNDKVLCQPDTGIARIIVHVVDMSHSSAATLCNAGVDLNSVLKLNDECPSNGYPKFCTLKSSTKEKGLLSCQLIKIFIIYKFFVIVNTLLLQKKRLNLTSIDPWPSFYWQNTK